MLNKVREEKGITLVVLIITIIVLLILAGISIATLTGDNGILTKATEAKDKTEEGEEEEKVKLSATGALAKENGEGISQDNLEEELGKYFDSADFNVEPGINESGEEGYIVTITENNPEGNKYFVSKDGIVGEYTVREPEEIPEKSEETAFSRANGVIEIEFLSGTSYSTTTTPNEPNLTSDMKKVYWEEDGTEVIEGDAGFAESKWYEYKEQSGDTTSGGNSHWANVKTEDGSYFVWIPRYAYRIVYFDTSENAEAYRADKSQTTGIIGYSDARGIVDAEGKTPSDLQDPVTSIGIGENKLRTHPAFETDLDQGGWSNKLEGIWIAKYEASEGTNNKPKFEPGVSSWRSITISNIYDVCKA